jgi:divalent metal cation (Fe/Co/Zn/Cd) transporter
LPIPLVERSQGEIAQIIRRRIETIKSVRNCHEVSVRISGKRFDVDMHISLDHNLRFEEVHRISSDVEREVMRVLPNARVTVHTEPYGSTRADLKRAIKETAESVPGSRGVHNVHIQEIDGRLCVDLHLEVSAGMTVKQAHEISDQVEKRLRGAKLNISEITVHMESASDLISRELNGAETEVKLYIEDLIKRFPEIKIIHGIRIRKIDDHLHVVLRCHFDPNIDMQQAHEVSSMFERALKDAYPNIDRIDIHEEPA